MAVDKIAESLDKLRRLREKHGFRAETLIPDLALIGLADDVIDAAEEALNLVTGPRPHRAWAMVRIAFEAAQRLIVLATDDHYIELGTRAWLYYVGKDEALRPEGDPRTALLDRRNTIIDAWALRYPEAKVIVETELGNLRKIRRPDNFLGRDMADAVADAYAKLARIAGTEPRPDAAKVEREAYRVLCRDAHACIRLEPRSLEIDSDGFVEVIRHERAKTETEEGVAAGLGGALGDAITALTFRTAVRDVEKLKRVREAANAHEGHVRPQFRRDFGLYLIERGLAHASQVFTTVELHNIAVLPDTTVSSSTTIGVDGEIYMASFDFKGDCADQILEQLRIAYPALQVPERISGEHRICHLPQPYVVGLVAAVAYFHHNSEDKFAPLLVSKVF
jgi:hypothetical protein